MFKRVSTQSMYKEWLETAHLIDPQYDYFAFAQLCNENKCTTNAYYMTLINKIVKENPTNRGAIAALNQFHKRENTQSAFGEEYRKYWERRETSKATSKAHKRRLDTFLQLNEDTCEGIEAISKNARRGNADSGNTGSNSGSSAGQIREASSSRASENKQDNITVVEDENLFKEVITKTNRISGELGSFPILLFDDKGVAALMKNLFGEELYHQVQAETSLLVYQMSPFCSELISLITEAPPSTALLRKIIRKSTLGDEAFDPIIHADLSFVEVVATHFLNLITSPRNPLQHACMERTAASLTTVFILNNLFLSNNDIVDLGWFERVVQTTGTTKWDGVAFAIKDKKITPVLIEFSGGVKFNTTGKKEQDDEAKMVAKILNTLEYIEALQMAEYPIPQHYIRFFGGEMIFECIYLLRNGEYIKRKHFAITCPTTCEELILLIKKTPKLLDWKQTIIMQTKKMLTHDE